MAIDQNTVRLSNSTLELNPRSLAAGLGYRFGLLAILVVCMAACAVAPSHPPQPLPLAKVSTEAFSKDAQRVVSAPDSYTQAWWVPVEFWMAAFAANHPALADQARTLLSPYMMVAVIQADISPLGGFVFASKDGIRSRLQVIWEDEQEQRSVMQVQAVTDPVLQTLLGVLSPVLAGTMGQLGANMHFFVLSNLDAAGEPISSPYQSGAIRITLGPSRTQEAKELVIETPLNALFEPRLCANGAQAHVTWKYCPWDGKPL
jgi:hypothetical protein